MIENKYIEGIIVRGFVFLFGLGVVIFSNVVFGLGLGKVMVKNS